MRFVVSLTVSVLSVFVFVSFAAYAGDLNPTTAPGATNSYGVNDIYNRLDTGAVGAQSVFTEPTTGPTGTAGPVHTLNEVMEKAPVKDDTDGATSGEVMTGKKFWGLTAGEWGLQTGILATQTPDNTTVNQSAGNYVAFDLSAVDTDLIAGNIKDTVEIFGVTGTYTGDYPAPVPDTGMAEPGLNGVDWPNPRFTVNGDGTVTDELTGLMWLQDANCISKQWTDVDTSAKVTNLVDTALPVCANYTAVYSDWRLPTLRELQSLVYYGDYDPAVPNTAGIGKWDTDGAPFNAVQSAYCWSGTTTAGGAGYAWSVSMNDGVVSADVKTLTYYVWPVRGGQ
ncbi:DUF1566 domain-containing protein [Desulfococcaceae bacterium HSG9]|nr:DUF1566 domain-containing protein [Desulfococcaceae bacterium HSG9]